MKRKLTLLLGFAVTLAYSPAFAEETAAKGEHAMQTAADAPAPKAKDARTEKKVQAEKAVYRKITAEEVGMESVCPATGEKFKVTEKTPSVSYKDKNYFFCCPGCDKSFIKNPEKYLAKKTEAGKRYACPMGCAESDKPGKCPKCGMNMTEKKAARNKAYVCPMGEYEGSKPGKCPKCGMNLVEKK
ncbi:MAG: YHS domain-containing protein [Elusimicrobia bacterium]|nr:YHS domain-containing protein [Elusimicrobiota bacterium]